MTTTTDPIEEMAAHLRAEKEQTGLSYKQLERAAVRILGDDDAPTHETIRSYHQGTISAERVNDRLVLALCRIYNRPVAEIAPLVAKRLQVVRSQLDSTKWVPDQQAENVDCEQVVDGKAALFVHAFVEYQDTLFECDLDVRCGVMVDAFYGHAGQLRAWQQVTFDNP